MPEDMPHRMENERLQLQPVITTLQGGGFILGELLQRSRRWEGMGKNIPYYLQEQSHWKQEHGLIAVTFIIRMSS
jgi:hypothetical protein